MNSVEETIHHIKESLKTIATDVETLSTDMKTLATDVTTMREDVRSLKIQSLNTANRQLGDGKLVPYEAVPNLNGVMPVENELDDIRNAEQIQSMAHKDAMRYWKFYHPNQSPRNKSTKTLREDIRRAVGCMQSFAV